MCGIVRAPEFRGSAYWGCHGSPVFFPLPEGHFFMGEAVVPNIEQDHFLILDIVFGKTDMCSCCLATNQRC